MQIYRVLVDGHLDEEWQSWLGEMNIKYLANGTTLLEGVIADQAALFGLLVKLRDLGIVLLSVEQADEADTP